MVDVVGVSVSVTEDCSDEADFWRSVVEKLSSTVTGFGFNLEGVLGLERFEEGVDLSSSFTESRWLVFDFKLCEWRSDFLSLTISEPPLPSLLFNSSAAFCRSVFLRSLLGLSSFVAWILGLCSIVVSGGLGGASTVVTGTLPSLFKSLLLSRSVGSGV